MQNMVSYYCNQKGLQITKGETKMTYKTKVTRSDIYNMYGKSNVIIIPFHLTEVVKDFVASSYWSGIYGWNCDIYIGRDHAYTYGYRPFGISYNKLMQNDTEKYIAMMELDGVEKHYNPF